MNISNDVSTVTTQVSGGATIISATVSKTAETVGSHTVDPNAMEAVTQIMFSSEWLALGSFLVMVTSAVWNFFSTRRRNDLLYSNHAENLELKKKELELKERELALKEKGLN